MNEDNENEKILLYFHCKNCLEKKPNNKSPQEWSRVECGWTKQGIKIDCIRCGMKIVHIDLMGQKIDII